MTPFDLAALAPNGLRRGVTTGACAAAAVKAALLRLLFGLEPKSVSVTLPDLEHYVSVPVARVFEDGGWVRADVVKDAGDDPDATHRAALFARVRRNALGGVRFFAGKGVGTVTQPGLQIPVGEPAINPVPRAMMRRAAEEALGETEAAGGFDLQIGCENGEQIAQRTFNPRLGVLGGISILGTTGIVEPKSMASFRASIEVYIRVALGDSPTEIVLAPGNLGQKFARQSLDLPAHRVVQMANFIGFAFDCVTRALDEKRERLPLLWLVGHPGKLAKLLDGAPDTHSSESASAVGAVCRAAEELSGPLGIDPAALRGALTVEGVIEALRGHPASPAFWREIEARIARLVAPKLPGVDEIRPRLFQMNGAPLSAPAETPTPPIL